MVNRDNLLFYDGDLDATLRAEQKKVRERVESFDKNQLRSTPEADLIEHIVSRLRVEPLVLREDAMTMDQVEAKIDVTNNRGRNPFQDRGPIVINGNRVTVTVPFNGDPMLFKLRPNSWQSVFPRAFVSGNSNKTGGAIQIVMSYPADEPPAIYKQRLDEELRTINFYVGAQKGQVHAHNESLHLLAAKAIANRKEQLKGQDGIADLLGIPLQRKPGVPEITPVPIVRNIVRPLPPPPASGFKPEPGISNHDYEHILSVIRHEGRTFETTPKTYSVHGEEELRDILLAHLNGHYKGLASGEAFRKLGKTDIRIEDQERAAFVAECKVWKGQKELSAAVDQLQGYLTWRDCKTAMVCFNKHNAKFSELLEKAPESIRSHRSFKREVGAGKDGEWRFVMKSLEDESREIHVHLFLFNLFVA